MSGVWLCDVSPISLDSWSSSYSELYRITRTVDVSSSALKNCPAEPTIWTKSPPVPPNTMAFRNPCRGTVTDWEGRKERGRREGRKERRERGREGKEGGEEGKRREGKERKRREGKKGGREN